MKHLAILKLNSTVVTIRGDTAYNADGNVVEYDNDAAVAEGNLIALRNERNAKLAETDWTQGNDSPLSDSDKTAWATYRQSLRDITDSATSLDDVTWPEKP